MRGPHIRCRRRHHVLRRPQLLSGALQRHAGPHRSARPAGDRCIARHRARRWPGAGAGVPLPRGGAGHQGRPARSQARHPARFARHAAPAACRRHRNGTRPDLQRPQHRHGCGAQGRHRRRGAGRQAARSRTGLHAGTRRSQGRAAPLERAARVARQRAIRLLRQGACGGCEPQSVLSVCPEHRARGAGIDAALRRGRGGRGATLRRTAHLTRVAGDAPSVLRRAPSREDSRTGQGRRAAADRVGRHPRRRHHGRWHRDELRQRRHSHRAGRSFPGRAGPRPRPGARQLRGQRRQGSAHDRAGRKAHGAAARFARRFGTGRLRSRDRSGVREHGPEKAGVRAARQGVQARRHHRDQHVDAGCRRAGRGYRSPRRCRRHALLQPRQRDASARSRARRQDGARRARHGHAGGPQDRQGGGGVGRVLRLHRQPHGRGLHARGRVPDDGRRQPGRDRRRGRSARHGDGPVPHARHGRHRRRRQDGHRVRQGRRPAARRQLPCGGAHDVRTRPLRPEDRSRLLPLRRPQARDRPGDRAHRQGASDGARHRAARRHRPAGDRRATAVSAHQRGREDP